MNEGVKKSTGPAASTFCRPPNMEASAKRSPASPVLFFTFIFLFLSSFASAQIHTNVIENFEAQKVGKFPAWWKTWPFQRKEAQKVYRVIEENGNKFLHAEDNESLSKQLYKGFHWRYESFPYLNWRWRARTLPKGAKETSPATNDSACGVYIIFGRTTGHSIKFTWSTTLPVGTIYEKKRGETMFKILESGGKNLNQWKGESILLSKIYQELFKRPLKEAPSGIAILTDGNAVGQPAACDYDDFTVSDQPVHP